MDIDVNTVVYRDIDTHTHTHTYIQSWMTIRKKEMSATHTT